MADDLGPLLITGATGYLGRTVAERLRGHGWPVALTSYSGALGTRCDLTDPQAVRELCAQTAPSAVIHCAAMVPKCAGDYADERAAGRSVAMVASLSAHALCPIVLASSMTIYGTAPRCPAREGRDDDPASAYAWGKKAAEGELLARERAGDVAVRLPGLFGLPRRSGVIYQATRTFLSRGTFQLTTSDGPWAAMTVTDAAECLVRAATRPTTVTGMVMNAGYRGDFSLEQAVTEIAELCGVAWSSPSTSGTPFSMHLDRFETQYGPLETSFSQRLREFVDEVRRDVAE